MNFDNLTKKSIEALSKSIISAMPKSSFTTAEKANRYMLTGDEKFSGKKRNVNRNEAFEQDRKKVTKRSFEPQRRNNKVSINSFGGDDDDDDYGFGAPRRRFKKKQPKPVVVVQPQEKIIKEEKFNEKAYEESVRKQVEYLCSLKDSDFNDELYGRITQKIIVYQEHIIEVHLNNINWVFYFQFEAEGKLDKYKVTFTPLSIEKVNEILKDKRVNRVEA